MPSASYLLNYLLPIWLAATPAAAQEGEATAPPGQAQVVDGVEIQYGVVPAARAAQAHRQKGAGKHPHPGAPSGADQYHVDVALFDAATRARITDAKVWATVRELNTAGKRKRLEPETFGDALSFGNYFRIRGEGPFRIVVEVALPGRKTPIEAQFDYRTR